MVLAFVDAELVAVVKIFEVPVAAAVEVVIAVAFLAAVDEELVVVVAVVSMELLMERWQEFDRC